MEEEVQRCSVPEEEACESSSDIEELQIESLQPEELDLDSDLELCESDFGNIPCADILVPHIPLDSIPQHNEPLNPQLPPRLPLTNARSPCGSFLVSSAPPRDSDLPVAGCDAPHEGSDDIRLVESRNNERLCKAMENTTKKEGRIPDEISTVSAKNSGTLTPAVIGSQHVYSDDQQKDDGPVNFHGTSLEPKELQPKTVSPRVVMRAELKRNDAQLDYERVESLHVDKGAESLLSNAVLREPRSSESCDSLSRDHPEKGGRPIKSDSCDDEVTVLDMLDPLAVDEQELLAVAELSNHDTDDHEAPLSIDEGETLITDHVSTSKRIISSNPSLMKEEESGASNTSTVNKSLASICSSLTRETSATTNSLTHKDDSKVFPTSLTHHKSTVTQSSVNKPRMKGKSTVKRKTQFRCYKEGEYRCLSLSLSPSNRLFHTLDVLRNRIKPPKTVSTFPSCSPSMPSTTTSEMRPSHSNRLNLPQESITKSYFLSNKFNGYKGKRVEDFSELKGEINPTCQKNYPTEVSNLNECRNAFTTSREDVSKGSKCRTKSSRGSNMDDNIPVVSIADCSTPQLISNPVAETCILKSSPYLNLSATSLRQSFGGLDNEGSQPMISIPDCTPTLSSVDLSSFANMDHHQLLSAFELAEESLNSMSEITGIEIPITFPDCNVRNENQLKKNSSFNQSSFESVDSSSIPVLSLSENFVGHGNLDALPLLDLLESGTLAGSSSDLIVTKVVTPAVPPPVSAVMPGVFDKVPNKIESSVKTANSPSSCKRQRDISPLWSCRPTILAHRSRTKSSSKGTLLKTQRVEDPSRSETQYVQILGNSHGTSNMRNVLNIPSDASIKSAMMVLSPDPPVSSQSKIFMNSQKYSKKHKISERRHMAVECSTMKSVSDGHKITSRCIAEKSASDRTFETPQVQYLKENSTFILRDLLLAENTIPLNGLSETLQCIEGQIPSFRYGLETSILSSAQNEHLNTPDPRGSSEFLQRDVNVGIVKNETSFVHTGDESSFDPQRCKPSVAVKPSTFMEQNVPLKLPLLKVKVETSSHDSLPETLTNSTAGTLVPTCIVKTEGAVIGSPPNNGPIQDLPDLWHNENTITGPPAILKVKNEPGSPESTMPNDVFFNHEIVAKSEDIERPTSISPSGWLCDYLTSPTRSESNVSSHPTSTSISRSDGMAPASAINHNTKDSAFIINNGLRVPASIINSSSNVFSEKKAISISYASSDCGISSDLFTTGGELGPLDSRIRPSLEPSVGCTMEQSIEPCIKVKMEAGSERRPGPDLESFTSLEYIESLIEPECEPGSGCGVDLQPLSWVVEKKCRQKRGIGPRSRVRVLPASALLKKRKSKAQKDSRYKSKKKKFAGREVSFSSLDLGSVPLLQLAHIRKNKAVVKLRRLSPSTILRHQKDGVSSGISGANDSKTTTERHEDNSQDDSLKKNQLSGVVNDGSHGCISDGRRVSRGSKSADEYDSSFQSTSFSESSSNEEFEYWHSSRLRKLTLYRKRRMSSRRTAGSKSYVESDSDDDEKSCREEYYIRPSSTNLLDRPAKKRRTANFNLCESPNQKDSSELVPNKSTVKESSEASDNRVTTHGSLSHEPDDSNHMQENKGPGTSFTANTFLTSQHDSECDAVLASDSTKQDYVIAAQVHDACIKMTLLRRSLLRETSARLGLSTNTETTHLPDGDLSENIMKPTINDNQNVEEAKPFPNDNRNGEERHLLGDLKVDKEGKQMLEDFKDNKGPNQLIDECENTDEQTNPLKQNGLNASQNIQPAMEARANCSKIVPAEEGCHEDDVEVLRNDKDVLEGTLDVFSGDDCSEDESLKSDIHKLAESIQCWGDEENGDASWVREHGSLFPKSSITASNMSNVSVTYTCSTKSTSYTNFTAFTSTTSIFPTPSTPTTSTPTPSTPTTSTPTTSTPTTSTPTTSTPTASTPTASTPAASTPAASTPTAFTPTTSTPTTSTPTTSTPTMSTPTTSTPTSTSSPSTSSPSTSSPTTSSPTTSSPTTSSTSTSSTSSPTTSSPCKTINKSPPKTSSLTTSLQRSTVLRPSPDCGYESLEDDRCVSIAPSVCNVDAPSGEVTTAPSGKVAAAPSGEVAAAPSGVVAAAPYAEVTTAPSGKVAVAPSGEVAAAPSGVVVAASYAEVTTALSGQVNTAPSGPVATAPSSPVATASYGPVATAPSGPVATAPSGPVATAPSGPVATATSGPVATAPPGRVTTALSGQVNTAPSGPVATAPSSPVATAPSGPVATAPSGQLTTTPSGPVATAPSGPVATTPCGQVTTSPSGPVATALSGEVASAPSGMSLALNEILTYKNAMETFRSPGALKEELNSDASDNRDLPPSAGVAGAGQISGWFTSLKDAAGSQQVDADCCDFSLSFNPVSGSYPQVREGCLLGLGNDLLDVKSGISGYVSDSHDFEGGIFGVENNLLDELEECDLSDDLNPFDLVFAVDRRLEGVRPPENSAGSWEALEKLDSPDLPESDSDVDDSIEDPTVNQRQELCCPRCSFKTRNPVHYSQHTLSAHPSLAGRKSKWGNSVSSRPEAPDKEEDEQIEKQNRQTNDGKRLKRMYVRRRASLGFEQYSCGRCPYETSNLLEFRRHKRKSHETATGKGPTRVGGLGREQGQKKFQCAVCKFSTANARYFSVHRAAHKLRKGGPQPCKLLSSTHSSMEQGGVGRLRKYKCALCNYVTLNEGSYMRHVTQAHSSSPSSAHSQDLSIHSPDPSTNSPGPSTHSPGLSPRSHDPSTSTHFSQSSPMFRHILPKPWRAELNTSSFTTSPRLSLYSKPDPSSEINKLL
ncbi:serine-rich adhesin for platelets [Hyalella azteca]|uniref:Serine-rich adhesin for platelets n=1 Tax=Hyalella azteca TaxID=294128 RepID=A0A8B7PBD5_HYAAZ|nr:serine-rich adhesin for platelets [Hyalella azteca]